MMQWRSTPKKLVRHTLKSGQCGEDLPLVSVIIPAYNAAQFIATTLASVLGQTYEKLEVIVVDDGSQDQTVEIVQQFLPQDQRIILLRQMNSGVAAARNLAIQWAQGELIAPIDADDIWAAENLEKQVQCLLNAPDSVGLVYSWSVDIDECDRRLSGFHAATIQGNVYQTLVAHNFLGNASATLIRKQCLLEVGGYSQLFRTNQVQGCEDWELYLRLAEQYEFKVVPEFLVGYRKVASSLSQDFQTMANSQLLMLQFVRSKHPDLPDWIEQFSRSSFYLYFAQQNYQNQSYQQTLFWLERAISSDMTPLLRPGFYILLIQSQLRSLLGQPSFTTSLLSSLLQRYIRRLERFKHRVPFSHDSISQPTWLTVFFKVLASQGLHYGIRLLQLSP